MAEDIQKAMQDRIAAIEKALTLVYKENEGLISYTTFNAALNYTLLAGGKRIRPLLALIFAEICSAKLGQEYKIEDSMPLALALEMIHTYSLIHDDLPSMDNDDLRRGKPTCHKKYDEATAILTADALLTDAFSMLTKVCFEPVHIIKAINFVSICAGSKGMVAGQILDMAMENKNSAFYDNRKLDIKEALSLMNSRKTGDLLLASCCTPAILYNIDKKFYDECTLFAKHFGLAFQISDDILDIVGDTKLMGKPQGSDISLNKTTWVSLLGLDNARKEVEFHIEKAEECINSWSSFSGNSAPCSILSSLLKSLNNRVK